MPMVLRYEVPLWRLSQPYDHHKSTLTIANETRNLSAVDLLSAKSEQSGLTNLSTEAHRCAYHEDPVAASKPKTMMNCRSRGGGQRQRLANL